MLNRVMARLEPGHGAEDAAKVAANIGGEVVFEFRTFPGYVIDFDARTEEDLADAVAVLQADERVTYAYPDTTATVSQTPTPPHTIETLVNKGKINNQAYKNAGMEKAWNLVNRSRGLEPVVIAVVDDGLAIPPTGYSIPDDVLTNEFGLIKNIDKKRLTETDIAVEAGDKFLVDLDPEGGVARHGTAVTSVIVAANNNPNTNAAVSTKGFSGVVSSVNDLVYTLIFFGVSHDPWFEELLGVGDDEKANIHEGHTIYAFNVINSLEFVEEYKDQVDVVNMSFGFFNDTCQCYAEFHELIQEMDGTVFVAGAGNDHEDIENNVIPAALTTSFETFPALKNLITVSSVDNASGLRRKWSRFSNYGNGITLAAPGENVWVVDIDESDGYGLEKGTSYAAPMVTGTVALMKALNPDLDPASIKGRLTGTGSRSELVCRSGPSNSCSKPFDQLPILDAGEAVASLVLEQVEIRKVMPTTVRLLRTPPGTREQDRHRDENDFQLIVEVANTGSHTLDFRVEAKAQYELGESSPSLYLDLMTLGPKQEGEVKLTFFGNKYDAGEWNVNSGRWRIDIEVFANDDPPLILGSKEVLIEVIEVTELRPTPTPTPTRTSALCVESVDGETPRQGRVNREVLQRPQNERLKGLCNGPATPAPTLTLGSGVKAEIHSFQIIPDRNGGNMWLDVLVKNRGEFHKFRIEGEATSHKSGRSYVIEHPGKDISPSIGGSWGVFQELIPEYQPGEWEVTVSLYDATSIGSRKPLHSKTDTIHVAERPSFLPTVAPRPTPGSVPTPLPETAGLSPQEQELLTAFYNCMQNNLTFKSLIGSLTVLGDFGNPPPGSVLDEWDQFVEYYSRLFRRDPAAEEVVRDFLPVFCP